MIQGGPNEPRKYKQKNTQAPVSREDGRAGTGSREVGSISGVQTRGHRPCAVVTLEAEVHAGWSGQPERNQARPKSRRRSSSCGAKNGDRAAVASLAGDLDRASGDEKKEALGIEGPLYGRHLTKARREALIEFVDMARVSKSLKEICGALERTSSKVPTFP